MTKAEERAFYQDAYDRAKRDLAGLVRSHPSLLRSFLELCDAAETLAQYERKRKKA